jgi:hypothetical protein
MRVRRLRKKMNEGGRLSKKMNEGEKIEKEDE